MHAEDAFLLATEKGQDAVRGSPHGVLFPVEPRFELAAFFLFVLDHLGREHGTATEEVAHLVAGLCVFAHAFGNDVASTGQSLFYGVDPFFLIDEFCCHLVEVAGVLLLNLVGQRLKAAFDGHGGTSAAFGFVGEVEVLQLGHIGGGKYLFLQFGSQLALFADRG